MLGHTPALSAGAIGYYWRVSREPRCVRCAALSARMRLIGVCMCYCRSDEEGDKFHSRIERQEWRA